VGTSGCSDWFVGDNGIAYSDPVCESLDTPPARVPSMHEVLGLDELEFESETQS
jgi:hypothetical protein